MREESLDRSQKKYTTARIEIQVASVLMHAWSEVEHDLVYKPLQGTLSDEELAILDRFQLAEPLKTLEPVCTREEILEAMEEIRKIYVHPEIKKYLVDIAEASRQDGELLSGVSPRGTLALFKGIRAYAWLKGRDYVVPEDVKALAVPVLAHRLVLAGAGDTDAERRVMEEILKRVEVPVEDWKKK